jgi:hypothetical protein
LSLKFKKKIQIFIKKLKKRRASAMPLSFINTLPRVLSGAFDQFLPVPVPGAKNKLPVSHSPAHAPA